VWKRRTIGSSGKRGWNSNQKEECDGPRGVEGDAPQEKGGWKKGGGSHTVHPGWRGREPRGGFGMVKVVKLPGMIRVCGEWEIKGKCNKKTGARRHGKRIWSNRYWVFSENPAERVWNGGSGKKAKANCQGQRGYSGASIGGMKKGGCV